MDQDRILTYFGLNPFSTNVLYLWINQVVGFYISGTVIENGLMPYLEDDLYF